MAGIGFADEESVFVQRWPVGSLRQTECLLRQKLDVIAWRLFGKRSEESSKDQLQFLF